MLFRAATAAVRRLRLVVVKFNERSGFLLKGGTAEEFEQNRAGFFFQTFQRFFFSLLFCFFDFSPTRSRRLAHEILRLRLAFPTSPSPSSPVPPRVQQIVAGRRADSC